MAREFEIEDIPPEYGFKDEDDPEKRLNGQLFLVMTDQRALSELLSFFNNWKKDPDTAFPRGLAPLKVAFSISARFAPGMIRIASAIQVFSRIGG